MALKNDVASCLDAIVIELTGDKRKSYHFNMSEHTGIVVSDMDRFLERALVAELGHLTSADPDYNDYLSGAAVPLEPREFTRADLEWFNREARATDATPVLGRIAIVRPLDLSDRQLGDLQKFAAENPPDAASSRLRPDRNRALTRPMPDSLWMPYGTRSCVNKDGDSQLNAILLPNKPGMRTTTQMPNGSEMVRVAPHLDRVFGGEDAAACLATPNRFNLNLGPGDRSVVIGPDIQDMIQVLPLRYDMKPGLAYTRQYNDLLIRRGQPARVVIMKVRVGEGVFDLTEAKLHDGRTAESDNWSQSGFWLGEFRMDDPEFNEHFETLI